MTTQHTPAPWHVNKDDPTTIFNSMGSYVTRIDGNAVQTRAAIEGNAAFIVRACNAHDELVGALSTMLGAAEIDCLDDKSNVWRSAMIDARAALAKVSK